MELMVSIFMGLVLMFVYESATHKIHMKRDDAHFAKRRAIEHFDNQLANGMGKKIQIHLRK